MMAELLETGWLLALAPAFILARDRLRNRRRIRAVNRSLHELRRPLQALALSSGGRDFSGSEGFLTLAMSALGDLDRAVNGTVDTGQRQEAISCRDLIVAAVGRWRASQSESDLQLQLYWDAGEATVCVDPERMAQALDNLIANAIEHGEPPVAITGSVISDKVRITVSDRGPTVNAGGNGANGDRGGDPRHGHGLDLVSEVAAAHGGRFALSRSREGTVAALELPLRDPAPLTVA